MNFRNLLLGAVSGLLSAVLVDLNAWSKSAYGSPFDWKLAASRWLAGAAAGLSAGWSMS